MLEKLEMRRILIVELFKYVPDKMELKKAIELINFYILEFQFSKYYVNQNERIPHFAEIVTDKDNKEFFEIIMKLKSISDPKVDLLKNYFEDNSEFFNEKENNERKLVLTNVFSEEMSESVQESEGKSQIQVMAERLIDYTKRNSSLNFIMDKSSTPKNTKETKYHFDISDLQEKVDSGLKLSLKDLKKEIDKERKEDAESYSDNKLILKSKSIFGTKIHKRLKDKKSKFHDDFECIENADNDIKKISEEPKQKTEPRSIKASKNFAIKQIQVKSKHSKVIKKKNHAFDSKRSIEHVELKKTFNKMIEDEQQEKSEKMTYGIFETKVDGKSKNKLYTPSKNLEKKNSEEKLCEIEKKIYKRVRNLYYFFDLLAKK